MKSRSKAAIAAVATGLALLAGGVIFAADKYSVKVPNGLAFAEFKGYENWEVASVSQSGDLIEVILANPLMIEAFKAGLPAEGKQFPDGSKMAKIHWNAKKSTTAPAPTLIADSLHDIDFMARDAKRFPKTGGWGYAQFEYNAASDSFTPSGTGSDCGFACHTIVKSTDYVFTTYPKR
jgi:hypothetical protein